MIDNTKYKVKNLFKDSSFEDGFEVFPPTYNLDRSQSSWFWSYPCSKNTPSWWIKPHYSGPCLIADRFDTGNPYELTDKENTKRVLYDPEEKSLLMQIDARRIFKGRNKLEHYWPHLLIEQRNICDYESMPDGEEKRFYSANSDRVVVEYDIRLREYIPTTNPGDLDCCQFVCYIYLNLIGANFIYLGFNPFDNRGPYPFLWQQETGGANHIYSLTTEQVFGSIDSSFNAGGAVNVSDEWKHVEVDITPHIDRIIADANRDLIFGREVTRDEFYFSGTNMGYEVHGNISCTFEVKNFNLLSYIKKEEE